MNGGDLENIIYRCIDRYFRGAHAGPLYHERHGMVTSYDPQKYLAKVMLQPEGQETGWLPIETGHIGSDFGFAIGLTPGDGKTSGDQVIVRFQEGDLESGKVVQRVHSDEDSPPPVQSGEIVFWSKFKKSGGDSDSAQGGQGGTGQQIYLKNDGSLTVTDGNGGIMVFDGNGNCNINCTNYTLAATGNHSTTVGGDVTKNVTGKRQDNIGEEWKALAQSGTWPWLSEDDG